MKKDKQLKDIKRRRTCKIVCVLLFLLISVIGICVHFNIIKIPFVVDLLERTEQKQEFGDFSGQLIGESYIPKEENIVYDNDSKTSGYVNNMILIFAYSDVPRKQIVNIADSLGGSIVGEIPEIYQYQIQVGAMDKESLEFYCKKVMRFKEVKYAIIDRVYSMEKEDIALPNDPWRDVFQGILGVDWNEEKPQGYNWWIEASKVLSAWQYNESLATINVGVVDNGFDTSHEDLNITVLNNEVNSVEHHGTHVAGIIGATNNNETGITGILDKVQWTLAQIQKLNPHGEYLFMNNGKRIRENTFNKRLSSICDILKIDHRSTHKIRKTYGTTLLDNNVDDSIVSEQMGHSDIATTRKLYYFCNKSEKTKIAQINNAINF